MIPIKSESNSARLVSGHVRIYLSICRPLCVRSHVSLRLSVQEQSLQEKKVQVRHRFATSRRISSGHGTRDLRGPHVPRKFRRKRTCYMFSCSSDVPRIRRKNFRPVVTLLVALKATYCVAAAGGVELTGRAGWGQRRLVDGMGGRWRCSLHISNIPTVCE